jgi:hypothetical protein
MASLRSQRSSIYDLVEASHRDSIRRSLDLRINEAKRQNNHELIDLLEDELKQLRAVGYV